MRYVFTFLALLALAISTLPVPLTPSPAAPIALASQGQVRVAGSHWQSGTAKVLPGTALRPRLLWHLNELGFPMLPRSTQHVTVAVVDSGAECDLPDYSGKVTWGATEVNGSACQDQVGHGTHVTGIIHQECPACFIKEVRIFGAQGSTDDLTVAKGIEDAVRLGANIINLSLGGGAADENTMQAVEWAQENGVIVVAASGNDGSWGAATYPASYPSVLRIAACDANGLPASFSNAAPDVYACFPGVSIYSDFPTYATSIEQEYQNNGFQTYMRGHALLSGTSMATPSAVGALARLESYGISPMDAAAALAASATRTGARDSVGAGFPNVYAAYLSAMAVGQLHQWTPPTSLRVPTAPTLIVSAQVIHGHNLVYCVYNGNII